MPSRRLPALLPLVLALACGAPAPAARTPEPTVASPRITPGRDDADVAALADRLAAAALAHEPVVSALLTQVAAASGGELAGFQHRLKSRASTIRKIRHLLAGHPGWTAADVVLDDPLRYTLVVADAPPGTHVATVRRAFAELEASGHRVDKVKNYWPRGDNYSGLNCNLLAPDGLTWELQFHTPASYALKDRDHVLYERMREDTTPVAEKRVLFEQLARPWEDVPIPAEVLSPGALHPKAEIIKRPPP